MNSRDKYKYWPEAAEYDLESAKVMMNGGRYMYVAFMSQQAIEKLTKGNTHKDSDVDIAVFSNYFKNMSRVDGIHFLLLRAMDYDIDLEPQPFTMEEYRDPVGIVNEILKTGIEIPFSHAS